MRSALVFSILTLASCISSAQADAISKTHALLPPIQVDALIVTPIIATGPMTKEDVLVLDEAFAQNLVVISERGGGDVNQLTLSNKSDRPLFVLSGEVVIGGKQDRIIGTNTVIPAKSTMDVPVFCVEHGRWNGTTNGFTTAKALAHGRLRANASYRDQGQVWAEVANMNNVRNTENATDTYRTIAQQQANGSLGKLEKRLADGLSKISAADKKRMVGFVVALDGKVVTVDMFGSNKLFAKLLTKLVKSYLTESLDVTATAANTAPSAEHVKSFMADSTKAKAEKKLDTGASTTTIQLGKSSANSSVDSAIGNLYRNYNSM